MSTVADGFAQPRLPLEVARARDLCPGRNCPRACGPADCMCRPCRCQRCRTQSAKARRPLRTRPDVPVAAFQPRLFAQPSKDRSLFR